MQEIEFNDNIDQKFPYLDREKALALIIQAKSISPNASFMVLHELCRPPVEKNIDKNALCDLIEIWKNHNEDKLSKTIALMAEALGAGILIPETDGLELMQVLRNFPNQYNALAIVYFACYQGDPSVDDLYEEILTEWDPNR